MAETPDIRVATPGESGRDHIIISPFQFYVNGEDHLRVTSANSLTGVVLEISGRFFDQDTQQITPIVERHTPNTDRSTKQTLIRLGKGYVLNLAVRVFTGAPLVGQTFVILELVRGFTGATQFLGVMSQGYVTARQGLAWPGSPIQSSIEGGGVLRTIQGTTPGAGAEIAEVVPTGARWRLLTFRYSLVTGAAVANRRSFLLTFIPGPIALAQLESSGVQAASLTFGYNWGANLPSVYDVANGCLQQSFIHDTRLLAGQTVGTTTALIQAADQYAAPVYTVEEWLEVA